MQNGGGRNMDSKFRDSHITGKHPSSEDGAMKVNTLLSPRRKGEQRISQCSRHMYQFRSVTTGGSKMRNAFNRDHYRIIVSYRYRDNFDLSYRLSIKNSI